MSNWKSYFASIPKLLMALWRFLDTGVLPEGAALKEA
jgi:hypothetical protein